MEARRIGSGLAAVLAIACGGSTVSDDDTGGADGSAASGGSSGSGGDGSAAGGAGGAGGASGAFCEGTITPPYCNVVGAGYHADLLDAKECDPSSDVEQCTVLVPWELPCGCPTFVSSGQQLEIASLVEWQAAWKESCCEPPCPPCPPPDYGWCKPSSDGTGSCVDEPR